MPWSNIEKKVIRVNPDFSGPTVWQEDQQATIKIIASRHDNHDQDLADSISDTVNLDGYTVMRANFDMGSFKIINLIDGVDALDGVNKQQLDVVAAKADNNASDIAAIQTSDPASIITAVNWDNVALVHTRSVGDFNVPLKRFDDFKAGGKLRHLGADLTAAAVTTLDTGDGNRFYMFNNLTGTMDLNIIRPAGVDGDLGENYFVEGMVMVENGANPALITIQADGVDVSPSNIIGSPTLNANTSQTLSYIIQRTNGDVYRETYIWSAP